MYEFNNTLTLPVISIDMNEDLISPEAPEHWSVEDFEDILPKIGRDE